MITNFQSKKKPKEKAPCKCLSITMLDSVSKQIKIIILKHFWKNENMNKIKMTNLTDDDFEKSSSDESDRQSDNDKDNDESNK